MLGEWRILSQYACQKVPTSKRHSNLQVSPHSLLAFNSFHTVSAGDHVSTGVALSIGVDKALLISLLGDDVSRSASVDFPDLIAFHCERLSNDPPAIKIGCRSLSLPSVVP